MRSGLTYFMTDSNAINADFEFAGSRNYIDSSDPGRFYGFTLSQEFAVSQSMPLFAEYGVSYSHISGTDEGEQVDEWFLFAGIKYTFGQATVRDRWTNGLAIGSPRLPVRGSAWTEYID